MSVKNYNPFARLLHWLMAVIVASMICAGFYMANLDDEHPMKWDIYIIHMAFGFTVLCLIPIRLLWYLTTERPDFVSMPGAQRVVAKATHLLLYALLFMMPISGLTMALAGGSEVWVFGAFTIDALAVKDEQLAELGRDFHHLCAWIIAATVLLHVSAALRHHFVKKDATLLKMLGRVRSNRLITR